MATNEQLIQQAYLDQLGREADAEGLAYWLGDLDKGFTLNEVIQNINQSLEGQRYDTEALTGGYRNLFERNPEQEGFQYWMSEMQADPNRTSTWMMEALRNGALGDDITALQRAPYTSATVPALEADPYAGRYLNDSMYNVPEDAINVSRILDRDAVFATPVGQTPIISNYDGINYTSRPGTYFYDEDRANAQIGTALESGALSKADYDAMLQSLSNANNVYDMQDAFNAPKATVNMTAPTTTSSGTLPGTQTGVNATPVNFAKILRHQFTDPTNYLDDNFNLSKVANNTYKPVSLERLGTFGASDGAMMGAGNAEYASPLIKALRDSSQKPTNSNAGFSLYDTVGGTGDSGFTVESGGAFSPNVLQSPAASKDDVSQWNAYNAYRTSSLQDKTPILSFEQWKAQPPGATLPVQPTFPDTNLYGANDGGGA